MAEQYYVMRLWDYATPSFCSCDKLYIGTEEEIKKAIAAMENYDPKDDNAKKVKSYLQGDKAVVRKVAYRDVPALEECDLICSLEVEVDQREWEHINTWGFPYKMKCDRARVKQILVRYDGLYHRCVRVWFDNLCYESLSGKWDVLGTFFLGPSYLFDIVEGEDGIICMNNLLYVVEEVTADLEEAKRKMQAGDNFRFVSFCDDIFGDG